MRSDTDDKALMIQRHWEVLIRDITANGDPDDLKLPYRLLGEFQRQLKLTAIEIHRQGSYNKTRIASGIGITKQALAKWFEEHGH